MGLYQGATSRDRRQRRAVSQISALGLSRHQCPKSRLVGGGHARSVGLATLLPLHWAHGVEDDGRTDIPLTEKFLDAPDVMAVQADKKQRSGEAFNCMLVAMVDRAKQERSSPNALQWRVFKQRVARRWLWRA
jgi:hypothetical protein